MEQKQDRRVKRTRNMVLDAFLDLMIEKGYDAITVQDIIDRANIGRSTFYIHFTDKENLLVCSIEQLREFIREQNESLVNAFDQNQFRFRFSLSMLQHSQSHKRLYRAIVGKVNESPVMYHMQQMLYGLILEDIPALFHGSSSNVPEHLIVNYIVNTFITVLSWWMDQNMPCTAADIDNMFHDLVLKGISAYQ